MIDISRLYCGEKTAGEKIRYGWRTENRVAPVIERKPVVVWNLTRTCNLKCHHCYSDSASMRYEGELSTGEAMRVVDDLAEFKIPALLLSGGEPLLRKDIFEIAHYARQKGLRLTLSTNGTLISPSMAQKIRDADFTYVGISLDGAEDVHDEFRGVQGAFQKTLAGIRNCKAVHQKVGLRLTMTRHTVKSLPEIFNLMIQEKIDRACFYHLVFTGRGRFLREDALGPSEIREAVEKIVKWTKTLHLFGERKEILTVANPVDGVYLYLKLKEEGKDASAAEVYDLLTINGGGLYGSGVGLGCIDFYGHVHPDQFWSGVTLGNVKERRFSEIWMDTSNPLMAGLKDRLGYLDGVRCGSCRWLRQCGGGLRTRSFLATGDPWGDDPGCYLTEDEIQEVVKV